MIAISESPIFLVRSSSTLLAEKEKRTNYRQASWAVTHHPSPPRPNYLRQVFNTHRTFAPMKAVMFVEYFCQLLWQKCSTRRKIQCCHRQKRFQAKPSISSLKGYLTVRFFIAGITDIQIWPGLHCSSFPLDVKKTSWLVAVSLRQVIGISTPSIKALPGPVPILLNSPFGVIGNFTLLDLNNNHIL